MTDQTNAQKPPSSTASNSTRLLSFFWHALGEPASYILTAIVLTVISFVDYDPTWTVFTFVLLLFSFLAKIVKQLTAIQKLLER